MTITIDKEFDGNVTERGDERNGRIYAGVVGWRWIVSVDGVVAEDFDRLRDAEHYVRVRFGDAAVPKRTRAAKGGAR